MKLWSGMVTPHVAASRDFYVKLFGCNVVFDSDWFVLLALGGGEIGFLLPDLEAQALPFRAPLQGQGMWITIDVDDVEATCTRLQKQGVKIDVPLREEPWGDRHFVIRDPNGIGVDVVQRVATTS